MKLALAQINTTVGDLAGNAEKVLKFYQQAVLQGAELVVFPELALTGYPPQDLLLHEAFLQKAEQTLAGLQKAIGEVPALVGTIKKNESRPGRPLFNAAVLLQDGDIKKVFHKRLLPTYDVFDEDRYFEPGKSSDYFEWQGKRVGVSICEDIWNDKDFWKDRRYVKDPIEELKQKGCTLIVNLSASPWHWQKEKVRYEMLKTVAKGEKISVVLCNLVGGNDQLVFDGHSVCFNATGECLAQAKGFEEQLVMVDMEQRTDVQLGDGLENLFQALVLGTRDYVQKCGFQKVVLGLSGGIDSALVAVIAVHALGAENVMGVSLPSRFSSEGSLSDAEILTKNLGIIYKVIPIEESFQSVQKQCAKVFEELPWDVTEENMQSRLRGLILMALSNKFHFLVLTTGNKSELAVGYCTLYGDMCGALAVLADVPKTKVYELARWINREKETIPQASITKAPSAELRPDQTDQDTLPPYEILDEVLTRYVEHNQSFENMVQAGLEPNLVKKIMRWVTINEYKRQQAALGLKVTSRAFGRGRRMPIAHRFHEV
ncbi:MAG: NAD+ synthase [Verrucomicrobiae bacterium]|nr:NAD+ synthase [Verrucomicrobiae bacterium]